MSAPTRTLPRIWLLPTLLIAAYGVSAWLPGPAGAALVEHHQVVAGLHSATLEARINPEGVATSCRAEFVSQPEFETDGWGAADSVPCEPEDLGLGTEPVSTDASIGGLGFSTTYRYRFMLTAGGETTPAAEGQFSTFGIESFSFRTLDSGGQPDSQAGSYPYELIVKMVTPTTQVESVPGGRTSPTGTIKNLLNELPPGLIGNPTAVPRCPVRAAEENKCSGDAQVGLLEVRYGERTDEQAANSPSALYNTIAPQGKAARFAGFINASTDGFIDSGIRTGEDYGITSGGFNISGRSNAYAVTVRLWGVPADPSHDAKRRCPGDPPVTGCASTESERPFLRNPTSCGGPLTVWARVDAYQGPGEFDEAQTTLPAITGCDQLGFEPTIDLQPTSVVTDSPTGLQVDLHVPQGEDPDELATADLRDAVVKLPLGFTLNPSSANGLVACTPAQFGLTTPVGVAPIHTTAALAECPQGAKIGTVEVDTPLLDHPLPGSIYVAEPYQNPFGSLLAIYIAVDDPISGVVIKLAGHVEIGPGGQLTTSFAENPQLPFDHFKLTFFGGDLAALRTPSFCGSYRTTSTLTPWSAPQSGPPVNLTDSHSISRSAPGGICATSPANQPVLPRFEAGSESPLGGAFSPFNMRLSRPDGSQEFSSLTVTPPPGLLGRLAGIPYCPDAALAVAAAKTGTEERQAPSCPAASRVGSVVVGAGAGARPYFVSGNAYLAGPYKGAPLSLAFVTPAVAGPYDLGAVVVRAAIEVDPRTARITVNSDPIPIQLKGIPLDIRSIAVRMDRGNFTLNPTSCEEMAVAGSLVTVHGAAAPLVNRFKLGGCRGLKFKPRVSLRLRGSTTRSGHPKLKAVVKVPKKGNFANIARAQVGLPPAHILDQSNIKTVCTQPQLRTRTCPKGSIYGRAKAWSPLLDKPLEGPVYLGVGYGHKLPDLVADLSGQIRILLNGRIDTTKRGGLRSTFEVVPDAPVSRFVLFMKGGKKQGLLTNKENICRKVQRASARFIGHNGKAAQLRPKVANDCSRKEKKQRKRHDRPGR